VKSRKGKKGKTAKRGLQKKEKASRATQTKPWAKQKKGEKNTRKGDMGCNQAPISHDRLGEGTRKAKKIKPGRLDGFES